MDPGQIIIILIAAVTANLPFFSERVLFVMRLAEGKNKHLAWRLLELVVLYFVVGIAAYLLESRLGEPHKQQWEFYAITACLFLVLAYPGFVMRYLWNAKGR